MLNLKKKVNGHNWVKHQSPVTLLFTDRLLGNLICGHIKHGTIEEL